MAWEPVTRMARELAAVPGVRAVVLGGSRARGTHRPDSDWDLGVYYRGTPDLGRLAALASAAQGSPVEVAGPGGWGPWVNGGAWLRVDGVPVDWILRDLDRVERVWQECREGRYEVGVQAGHPLGFWSRPTPVRWRTGGFSPTRRASWPRCGTRCARSPATRSRCAGRWRRRPGRRSSRWRRPRSRRRAATACTSRSAWRGRSAC
ncbi:nucleotidyltransferase domain-containing protein [Actinomadura keratinilytica]